MRHLDHDAVAVRFYSERMQLEVSVDETGRVIDGPLAGKRLDDVLAYVEADRLSAAERAKAKAADDAARGLKTPKALLAELAESLGLLEGP